MSRYDQLYAEHEWNVPERYNIAADVCDKHPRDKQAMIWERFDGARRDVSLGRAAGPLQPGGQRPARPRRRARRARRRRAAADARDGGRLLRHVEERRHPALDVGPLRRRRHRAPPARLAAAGARHRQGQRGALRPVAGRRDPRARRRAARRRLDRLRDGRHRRRRPGAALLHERHHRPGQGHRPRPSLRARARGVRLLPRGPGRRALPRHGRVGVGGRHLAAARAVAPGRRPGRPAAQGRLRPRPAARLPQPPRGHERLHDARRRCGR